MKGRGLAVVAGTGGFDILLHSEAPSQRSPTGPGRDMPTTTCLRWGRISRMELQLAWRKERGLLVMDGREVHAGQRCASKVPPAVSAIASTICPISTPNTAPPLSSPFSGRLTTTSRLHVFVLRHVLVMASHV